MTAEVVTEPASRTTTPAGVEIAYFTQPRRYYTANGVEVPSVTTVLGVLDKPALSWWGMTTGIEAMRYLIETNQLTVGFDGEKYGLIEPNLRPESPGGLLNTATLTDLVSAQRLTVNHVKSKAADRGTGVHNALEAWCALGALPEPDSFPEEERGYVTGLRAFLDDAVGLEAESFEVTVASVEHGYAGRFDLLAKTTQDMKVVYKTYPKWPSKYTVVPAGSRILVDLKTSKNIYTSHLLQLGGYEIALEECGYGTIDARAVLHVAQDGRYEFMRARNDPQDFLAVLGCYYALKRAEEALKLK